MLNVGGNKSKDCKLSNQEEKYPDERIIPHL